jgi:hypothetical protein
MSRLCKTKTSKISLLLVDPSLLAYILRYHIRKVGELQSNQADISGWLVPAFVASYTEECVGKESLLENLPLPLPSKYGQTKEGCIFLPWKKGGQEGFYN